MTAPTGLSISAHSGSPDHVTVTLRHAADNSAVIGQKVTVYYRYAGHKTWVAQKPLTTTSAGTATTTEQPKRSCYFKAKYAGSSTLSASSTHSVHVSK